MFSMFLVLVTLAPCNSCC